MAVGYEEELKAEIARLRDSLDEQTGRAVWNYECLTQCEERVIRRDAEIARLRLTDAEREAIDEAICDQESCIADCRKFRDPAGEQRAVQIAATLRGLRERHKGGEFDR